jgi:hypothetical protein
VLNFLHKKESYLAAKYLALALARGFRTPVTPIPFRTPMRFVKICKVLNSLKSSYENNAVQVFKFFILTALMT